MIEKTKYDGTLRVRMPESLIEDVTRLATTDRAKMSDYVRDLIRRELARRREAA